MEHITVKIINESPYDLPSYETPSAAGMDVRANISEPVTLGPLERRLIPTGLRIQLPQGYECQIRPRSGLALRHGLSLVNTPGTVDADYPGERIAQMVVKEYVHVSWDPVGRIDDTVRGDGGFGHTGTE